VQRGLYAQQLVLLELELALEREPLLQPLSSATVLRRQLRARAAAMQQPASPWSPPL
jgi:hypothetical protein